MAAIRRKSVIFSRKFNVLLNSPAVFEAETEIVCAIGIAAECRSLIIVRREGNIRLNSNSPFKTDSITVLCRSIMQFSR
jgi:hypothetical protein